MKRMISVLLVVLLCILTLASCSIDQTDGTTTESTVTDTPQVTPEATTPAETTGGPTVTKATYVIKSDFLVLEIYQDGLDRSELGEHIYFFDEIENCPSEWVLVWKVNTALKDFKFLAMDESEDLRVDKVLYSLSELTSDMPLVIATYINDATINRGISFTDANGNTVYYVIELSMADGSYRLSRVEFDTEM